jgi:hypothetical protein
MAWIRKGNTTVKPNYTGLQLNTSASTLPIPILWGQNKLAGNVIWYERFYAQPTYSGGGKGGGKGGGRTATGYNYYCDLIIALCEGPISSVARVWQDQTVVPPWYLGFNIYTGTTSQGVWPWLSTYYSGQDIPYPSTAYAAAANYSLGSSATVGNLNFEIIGPLAGTGVNGIDADPAQVINDFLTNAQYGAGLNPASIDSTTLFGSGGDASLQTWCKAMGYAFSPVLSNQEQGSSILTRWLQILSCAAVWSGGKLRFIPYGDTVIAGGAQTTVTQQFSIPTPIGVSTGYAVPAPITVSGASQFVADGGVKYASTGLSLTFVAGANPTLAGTYCMSPAGTYIFAPADEGKPAIISYTVAAPISYSPNLTPVYALTDADFVDENGNKDPLQVERADIFSLPTIQRIEVSSRSNRYSAIPVEARDQSQIEVFGPRVGTVIQAHEICDEFTMGPAIGQAILQRGLYVRTKFAFKLSAEYCLLDPMDIVTITDANLGLSNYPVRITNIEEGEKGILSIAAEELVFGVSTPALNPSATGGSYTPNLSVPAVAVNTPLIFQPPISATGGAPQIWIGASGVNGGGSTQWSGATGINGGSTQWGGAYVWVSVDGASYSQVITVEQPLRQGFLTASLPAAFGWDAADALAVNLVESGGTLAGTTQQAAQQGATLSLVDNELLAYEVATLTAANAYNLTGLARGLSGTSPAPHASGAPFARIDGAIVKYNLPSNLAGQTLYFKFQSYNVFGQGVQALSACAVYTFNPTNLAGGSIGASTTNSTPPAAQSSAGYPIGAQLASGFALDLGQSVANPTISDDFGSVTASVTASMDLGVVMVIAHSIAAQLLGGSSLPFDLGATTAAITLGDDFGSVPDPVIDIINLGTAP